MGRNVWVPVVSGPLAPYAAGFASWLRSRAYSRSTKLGRYRPSDALLHSSTGSDYVEHPGNQSLTQQGETRSGRPVFNIIVRGT